MKTRLKVVLAATVLVAGILNIVGQATSDYLVPTDNIVRYSGLVTDPTGMPVLGAIVTAYPGHPSNAVAVTDREGRFEMDLKRAMVFTGNVAPYQYLIVRETNRNLAFIRGSGWQGSNLDVQLQPGVNMSIKVKDGAGRPVPGAVGELSPMVGNSTGSSGTPLRPDLISDADGRMEMKAFPRGHAISLVIKAEGHGIKFLHASEAQTDAENYQFPDVTFATADKEVSGKVLDEMGNPVPGAHVTASSGNGPVVGTTDEQGQFQVSGVTDGPFNISANVNGASGDTTARGGDTNIAVHLGRPATAAPPFVEGTVTDLSGRPAANVRVALVPLNQWDIYTDADGHYRIDLPAGVPGVFFKWCVYAQDQEHNLAVLQWLDPGSTHIDLQLKQGVTLVAKFQDGQGRPVSNGRASLLVLAGNARYVLDPQLSMDPTGAVRAVAAPAGQRIAMEVKARSLGTKSLEPDPRETAGRAMLEFPPVIMKSANQIVSGQVLDENGKPLAQAVVMAQGPNQPGDRTHTDAAGRFTLDEIMEGEVRLMASFVPPASGLVSSLPSHLTANVTTRSGDTNVVVRLIAPKRASTVDLKDALNISGTVKDASGVAVAGVVVSTLPPSEDFTNAVTDLGGRYSLDLRPAKNVVGNKVPMRIMARDIARNRVAISELEEDVGTKLLILEPGLDLSGMVTERTGEPVVGAAVLLNMTRSDPTNRHTTVQVLRDLVMAGQDGKFEISALPRGWAYGFRVAAEDHAIATKNITAADTSGRVATVPAIQMEKVDHWIAGTVVDTNGNPVREVTIQVRNQGLTNMNAYTDVEGRFKLRVCEGPLTVFAIYNPVSQSGSSTQARLSANGGDTNLVLRLAPPSFPAMSLGR